MNEKLSIPDVVKSHPAWHRLEDQHKWYSEKSVFNQKWYKRLKLVQIVIAAFIPIISLIDVPQAKYLVALFGAAVVIFESIQQLYRFHTLWTEYRSTAEHLRHEQYLFLSLSGPYRELNQEDALLVLAERIEEHISKEHAKWIDTSKKTASKILKDSVQPAAK
jgi:Protein of unknown function (DUF4231)